MALSSFVNEKLIEYKPMLSPIKTARGKIVHKSPIVAALSAVLFKKPAPTDVAET